MSHKLQYKREAAIPQAYRRKLVRLAGILELADEQFAELREAEASVAKEVRSRLEQQDSAIPIDAISLKQYVETSPRFRALAEVAEAGSWIITKDSPIEEYSKLALLCQIVGVHDIAALENIIVQIGPKAPAFTEAYFDELGLRGHVRVPVVVLANLLLTGASIDKIDDSTACKLLGWDPAYFAALARTARRTL
jgi:hypothetical protein